MPLSAKKTYYDLLGVSRCASTEQVKAAYRRLAREHHPDMVRMDASGAPSRQNDEEIFKLQTAAYHTLSDSKRRAAYDALLAGRRGTARGNQTPAREARFRSVRRRARLGKSLHRLLGIDRH